jgi:hypothetical protein
MRVPALRSWILPSTEFQLFRSISMLNPESGSLMKKRIGPALHSIHHGGLGRNSASAKKPP